MTGKIKVRSEGQGVRIRIEDQGEFLIKINNMERENDTMACDCNDSMKCPCTYNCARRGKCCACLANHLGSGGFPACFFSPEAEKKYDRSYEALKKDRG